MWELDHKTSWAPKNWCFWIVMMEKTPENPLDCKEIKPVNPKGNQPWIFTERTESWSSSILGHLMWRADSLYKTLMLGKIEKGKGVAEDTTVRQHNRLNGHEFEPTPGDSEGQGSPACCSPYRAAQSQTRLTNWTTTNWITLLCTWN